MVKRQNLHEDFSRKDSLSAGSNRSFGLVFTAVFAIIGALPLWHGEDMRTWAVVVAVVLALVTAVRPSLLAPANQVWFRFGLLLGAVLAPVVMMLVFLVAVTPTAFLMRLLGKDPLRLKFDRKAQTYWLSRDPKGSDPKTMVNQF